MSEKKKPHNQSNIKIKNALLSDSLNPIQKKKDTLFFTGQLVWDKKTIEKIEMILIGKKSEITSLSPVSFQEVSSEEKTIIEWQWTFRAQPFIKNLLVENTGNDTFYVRLMVHLENETSPLIFSLSFPEEYSLDYFKELPLSYGRTSALLATSVTEKGFLELTTVFLDKELWTNLSRRSLSALFPFQTKKTEKTTWLLGYKPDRIGENSWALFEHIKEHYPEIDCYYVLDPGSSAWKTAKNQAAEQLLAFNSENYFHHLMEADHIISESLPFHLYPSMSPVWDEKVKAKKTVLPAYPFGLTNGQWTVNQHFIPWKIDQVVVSSKGEARFAHETLGYKKENILLTGLPGHQLLVNQDDETENLLLLVPELSQKKWHSKKHQPEQSLQTLSQSEELKHWLSQQNMEILVLLTEEERELKEDFVTAGIKTKTLDPFEKYLWMQKAKVLLTDSHSLALEFSLLEKPVLFYQPETISHLVTEAHDVIERTYQNELPGEVAETEDQVLHVLQRLFEEEFQMTRRNLMKARALFEFHDTGAEDRLIEHLQLKH